MNSTNYALSASVNALCFIGSDGVARLAEALTNGPIMVRICIAQIVPEAGTNAYIAIPPLIQCLKYQSSQPNLAVTLKSFAAAALGVIGQDFDQVVPALATALKDRNYGVRFTAARALGEFGENAEMAMPALRKALKDPNPHVRSEVVRAIKRIEQSR